MGIPPAGVLLPAEGEEPVEALAEGQGSGAVADAAFDEGGHTGLLFGPKGPDAVDGILHFDGSEWKREPIEIPPGSEADFEILAIDATGLGNAWALAAARRSAGPVGRPAGADVRPPKARSGSNAAERDAARRRRCAGQGIAGAAPIGGASQPLTVTADGVWIDLTATFDGVDRDVTVFYDIGDAAVTGSWCDAATSAAHGRWGSSSRARAATAASPGPEGNSAPA